MMAENSIRFRVWHRVGEDGDWKLPTVEVFETTEAAEAYAGKIHGEVRVLPADVAPLLAEPASAQAVKQGKKI
jgi:hypothetical protein